jgi:hypothetical protein
VGVEREKGGLMSLHILMAKLRALEQTTRGCTGRKCEAELPSVSIRQKHHCLQNRHKWKVVPVLN